MELGTSGLLVAFHKFLQLLRCLRANEMFSLAGVYFSLLRLNFKDVGEEVVEDVLAQKHRASNCLPFVGECEEFVVVLDDEVFRLKRFKIYGCAASGYV